MKKITLNENEKIVHKIKYSNKSTVLTFLFFLLFMTIFNLIYKRDNLSLLAFLLMFGLVIPSFIKLLLNLYRRTLQRIYITTERIIIVNGYLFKLIKTFNINTIVGVYYKAKKFDKVNGASTIKCVLRDGKSIYFKKVTFGPFIAELLSVHLKQEKETVNLKNNKKLNKNRN